VGIGGVCMYSFADPSKLMDLTFQYRVAWAKLTINYLSETLKVGPLLQPLPL
jgi:hypothetical protein